MNSNLLGKEVLCIFDTRQIQRYIFRSNSYYDILGASDLINDIMLDSIRFALKSIDDPLGDDEYDISTDPNAEVIPYFTSEKIKFQLIVCAAGNAMCIVRTGGLAGRIIRKIARYYLDHGCTLNFAAAAVEKTNDMKADIFALYKELDKVKASANGCEPLGALGVVMKEHVTGDPVIGRDEEHGDYISMTSLLKRKKLGKRTVVYGIEDIHTTKDSYGRDYLAVIHGDGNNLGITIGRILQNASDYEQGIRLRRKISRNIMTLYDRIMKKTMDQLKEHCRSLGMSDGDIDREFLVIHQAGDDVNCICNASMAFKFAELFYNNLDGETIWESDDIRVPLYVCMGIAFITPDNSFISAFELAEKCCKSAKTEAKKESNLIDGFAGNWIDFQVCDNLNSQELDMLRQRYYVTGENIDLLLRPYCMDGDSECSFTRLKQRALALPGLGLTRVQSKILRQSYIIGRNEFNYWVQMMKKEGVDLVSKLGSPIYRDKENNFHAAWFDAVEIGAFMR